MDRNRLIGIARMYMGSQKTSPTRERGYTYHHGLRTANLAQELVARLDEPLGVEEDVLFAGALFHDLGKGEEDHHLVGAARAMSVLNGALSPDELRQVAELIEHHNQRDAAETLPVASRVVQDADTIDHMGVQRVWLALFQSAGEERGPAETVEHYFGAAHQAYIASLRDRLHFSPAVEEFDRRMRVQETVFSHLADEVQGHFCQLPASGVVGEEVVR